MESRSRCIESRVSLTKQIGSPSPTIFVFAQFIHHSQARSKHKSLSRLWSWNAPGTIRNGIWGKRSNLAPLYVRIESHIPSDTDIRMTQVCMEMFRKGMQGFFQPKRSLQNCLTANLHAGFLPVLLDTMSWDLWSTFVKAVVCSVASSSAFGSDGWKPGCTWVACRVSLEFCKTVQTSSEIACRLVLWTD